MRMLMFGLCLLGLVAGSAWGEPYYLRYDADVFPEEAGWERHSTDPHGEVIRTIEDGVLTIDSSASLLTTDWYLREIPELELSPGEELRLEWRMRTLMTQTHLYRSDVVVVITNAASRGVEFFMAPDFISVQGDEPGHPAALFLLEDGAWNTFQLVSSDLEEYTLFANGRYAFNGSFVRHFVAGPNLVCFGDAIFGRSSISEWDFCDIGVVPEPQALALVLAVGILTIHPNVRGGVRRARCERVCSRIAC